MNFDDAPSTALPAPAGRELLLYVTGLGILIAALFALWLWRPPLLAGLLLLGLVGIGLFLIARQLHRVWQMQRAYQLAMLAAHDGFWEWDPVSKRLRVGARLLDILGYRRNFLPDTHAWIEIVHPDDRAHYNRTVAEHLKGQTPFFYCEYRVRSHSGAWRWIASRGIAVRNRAGIATQMAGSVTDITERKQHEEAIAHLARHDRLTGLPNRVVLGEQLDEALRRVRDNGARVAVLFIDLDRFKDINDSLGHRLGDGLLQSVAQRLSARLETGETLVRQGGDEFIVIIPDVTDVDTVTLRAESLLDALEAPFAAEGYPLHVGASIGWSLYPDDAADGEALLRGADTAMYAAKQAGGGTVRRHTAEMQARVRRRTALEAGLRRALDSGGLSLHYQPQIELASGRLIGAEALLRWHDGERFVSPEHFIPVAEETGLIVPIGDWVLESALTQLADWRAAHGARAPRIAINLSPRQFWRQALDRRILDLAERHGVPAAALELEITESMLLQGENGHIATLRELRAAGCKLALDDFGTGYSSLSYLQRLPFTTLKIDRAFVARLLAEHGEPGEGEPLVRAIIAMAHSLGLEVVAEGVEEAAQLTLLRDLDCDIWQGYLAARPQPAGPFAARWLDGA